MSRAAKLIIIIVLVIFATGGIYLTKNLWSADSPTPGPNPSPPQPAATPYVRLPNFISSDPGKFISIAADTNGTSVSWISADPSLDMFPTSLLKDTKTCVVVGSKPGIFMVYAVTAKGEQVSSFASCQVTITGAAPPPTPVPPTPTPIPEPTDPLWPALKSAWSTESAVDKASVSKLSALYKQAVVASADQSIKTWGDLFTVLSAADTSMLGKSLPGVRSTIKAELAKVLPSTAATPIDRTLAATTFTRMATMLDALPTIKR